MENSDNFIVTARFKAKISKSIQEQKFVKLTLSKPCKKVAPKNIFAKLIETKKGLSLSCTLRFSNKDIVQNLMPGSELENQLDNWLGATFKIATLICSDEESSLVFNNKNRAQLNEKQSKNVKIAVNTHNKGKNYLIKEDSEFLKLLSVSSKEGRVLANQQDKYRQINKYCEIMLNQLEQFQLLNNHTTTLRIVDMGSGKGYLTFALYYLLREKMNLNVEIIGVELRSELCDFCNEQAEKLDWSDNLKFAAMDIRDFEESSFDVLIALHACDTATDVAISQGIVHDAKLIVVAPCCHKQIRKEMNPKVPWNNILKNGILLEREAELLTDAIRALLLEREGFKTRVFEFISGEHTPKNLMITAGRQGKKLSQNELEKINHEISALKEQFGIERHYLELLLQRK